MAKNFKRPRKDSRRKNKIIQELAKLMMDGEVINANKALEKYFEPKTILFALQAKKKMDHMIQSACKIVCEEGKFAGSLGDRYFGVPQTKQQTIHLINSKFTQLKGRSRSGKNCVTWAIESKLLPESVIERFNLPAYALKLLPDATQKKL